MSSIPLFIRVALSIVIFAPIAQTGCRRAISGVTASSFEAGQSRKGPPEAVRKIRRTGASSP